MIPHYNQWKLYTLTSLFLVGGVLWYIVFSFGFFHEKKLRFIMLDIGQGDALFIESPTGTQVLVDGGPGDALLGQLGKVMPVFDRTIDMLINTNPDKDHFEGFIPVLDRYSVGLFMQSGSNAESNSLWRLLEKKVKDAGIKNISARVGQRIDIGGGAYIDIIFPDRDVSKFSHNDASLIARLVYGKTTVLLMGDTTQKIEKYLVETNSDAVDVDILKIAHHGSRTSTSEELVRASSPDVALISAGRNNQFGHPHKETVDTLKKYNVPYVVTAQEGMIEYDSDGEYFVRIR